MPSFSLISLLHSPLFTCGDSCGVTVRVSGTCGVGVRTGTCVVTVIGIHIPDLHLAIGYPRCTRYAAFRNTAFSSTVALYLIGVPNMQYDDIRLDSVKAVFRVFSPEYRVPKGQG